MADRKHTLRVLRNNTRKTLRIIAAPKSVRVEKPADVVRALYWGGNTGPAPLRLIKREG